MGEVMSASWVATPLTTLKMPLLVESFVALSIVYPAGDSALAYELRRLRTLLPKEVALVIGGAASPGYGAVVEEIGATPVADLADFRAQLRALRRARKRTR